MKRNRIFPFLFLAALLSLGFAGLPQAQSGFTATNVNISYNFGQQITFLARLTSSIPIQQATLSFRNERVACWIGMLDVSRARNVICWPKL